MNEATPKEKVCFFIAPIGEEGGEIRQRSDQISDYILQPIAGDRFKYKVMRAHEIATPGIITAQIIDHLLKDDLVVADLTTSNANVFYELAIRHAARKPSIHMIQKGDHLSFDVAGNRAIIFDYHDLSSVAYCKQELEKQIQAIEQDPTKLDNPITAAIDILRGLESNNPLAQTNAEIMQQLTVILLQLRELSYRTNELRVQVDELRGKKHYRLLPPRRTLQPSELDALGLPTDLEITERDVQAIIPRPPVRPE